MKGPNHAKRRAASSETVGAVKIVPVREFGRDVGTRPTAVL